MDDAAVAPKAPAAPSADDFCVVGIGASAGGLKGLLEFFSHMPADSGLAFVVILHLSPQHESNLDKVLQTVTAMPVTAVTEAVPVQPNHVYVISPAKQLSMVDGTLRVAPDTARRERHVAIDLFFRTLAETRRTRAIGIVLSGSGTDGTLGLRSVKEAGGLTLAQAPGEAEYDSMPRSAIGTGMVDFVLPVAEMPAKLISLARNARLINIPLNDEPPAPDAAKVAEAALRDVLTMLRLRTGHDFAQYKRATVLRRIERRLQVNQLSDLVTYRDYLRDTPEETQPLLKDMLISVTNFFRDRGSFEALERIAIPALFEGRASGDQIRVWVAGCATGEEAYSIAMLLAEYADTLPSPPSLQVFATDIDEDAIAVARAGLYADAIVADVPPARLRRFFSKEPGGYRVDKSVRETVLFAAHNLIRDPPFSRIDLVACRNVLIYLNREIQGAVLELIHFSLRQGGYVLLGTSESIDEVQDMFVTTDKPNRLYRSQLRARARPLASILPTPPRLAPPPAAAAGTPGRSDPYGEIHQSLLESYAPPSVVVDDRSEIVHLSDSAGQFLQFTAGAPSLSVVNALLPALRMEVRAALNQAFQTMTRVRTRRVEITRPTGISYVDVTVQPVRDAPTSRTFALVIFDETDLAEGPTASGVAKTADKKASAALQGELANTREQLRATIEQYETQNEELKASNEELQAINEELRAATEELETSKEELQSINEELTTVNQELKSKIDEMTSINNDLQNFIASTEISVLFVDRNLRLMRFTPQAREFFNVITSDVGRPLLDITHRLDYAELQDDVTGVLASLRPVERQLRSDTGKVVLLRMLPYRTTDDKIEGTVLTLVDVTARTENEERLRRNEKRYRSIINSIHDYAIVTTNLEGLIDDWSVGGAPVVRLQRLGNPRAADRRAVRARGSGARHAAARAGNGRRQRPRRGRALAPAQGRHARLLQRRDVAAGRRRRLRLREDRARPDRARARRGRARAAAAGGPGRPARAREL